ncbi:MAG: methyltransferase, partial [Nocardioides sp.]|uniref:methyltransferase n=1 Tax=Nocardioides sp. TaxID=35761 RepID=UPI003F008134
LAVRHLAARAADAGPGRLLDLCCGAAPVPAVVLDQLPGTEVLACDVDPAATAAAALTLAGHPSAAVLTGDLFAPVPAHWRGTVDVVSANAPYVPSRALATMPAEARLHEPVRALDGGADGLAVHRRIAEQVSGWLAPDGVLLVELAPDQLDEAAAMYAAHGLLATVHTDPALDATALVVGRS